MVVAGVAMVVWGVEPVASVVVEMVVPCWIVHVVSVAG